MSEPVVERLYNLLPTVYRVRDVEQGEPLRTLLGVLESELTTLREDIDALYDDWFIETCAEWVVPYIGDLVGVRGLLPSSGAAFSQRGRVANALAQRRGKGTAAALEQLSRDVTGWHARVVEFFQLLATAQHINHIRPSNLATVDLRDVDGLELLGGPFERATRSVEVRHVDNSRGKYDIPYVGIFLWRLQSYAIAGVTARAVPDDQPAQRGRFRFNPLGFDAPLFSTTGPVRRRDAGVDQVFTIRVQTTDGGRFDTVAPEQIAICDLSDPPDPAPPEGWRRPSTAGTRVAVDPVLGRLAFAAGVVPNRVAVDYAYGFGGDIGGGPYNRRDSVTQWLGAMPPNSLFRIQVGEGADVATLRDAVARWNAQPPGSNGVITVLDSRTYAENLSGADEIVLPPGSRLLLVAAEGRRPHVLGDVSVRGSGAPDSITLGGVCVNGLLIEGHLNVSPGNLGELRVEHATIVPQAGALSVQPPAAGAQATGSNERLEINVHRSIVGPVRLTDVVGRFRLVESIADGADSGGGIAIAAAATGIDASTVFGGTVVASLDASNSIFTDTVRVERRQSGCTRFSYIPHGSLVPRRFRCQPADDGSAARITPRFTSTTYGRPGYAQLAAACPVEISAGADDEGEMGAFQFLQQTQRLGSLRASLDEHLRFGLEAGVFLVT